MPSKVFASSEVPTVTFCQGKPQSGCSHHLGVAHTCQGAYLMAMNHLAEWNLKNAVALTHEASSIREKTI